MTAHCECILALFVVCFWDLTEHLYTKTVMCDINLFLSQPELLLHFYYYKTQCKTVTFDVIILITNTIINICI